MEIRPMVIAPFDKFRFTWVIEKFSSLKKKQYSEIFTVGGCNWRLLIYPEGNAVEQLSIYLDVVDSTTLSIDWSIYAYFILAVVSQIHPKLTIKKETELTFNAKQSDWGFKSFIPLRDVRDPTKGYLVDDTLIVEAEFSARRVGQSEAVSPSQSSKVRLEKKQEEKGKKENAEAHLYAIIKVARDEDLADQIGKDIYFDLVNHDKVQTFRVQKQWVFTQFKEQVVKFFRIPAQHQRFWLWAKRQNNTYRPFRPITQLEESQSVGHLLVSTKAQCAELHLFLEVEHGLGLFQSPPERKKDDILLFFKLYDPEKATLRYVGRSFEKLGGKPKDCLMKLNEMAGFPPDTRIKLYEEIKFEPHVMCELIDKQYTFGTSEIEDGDIICFQRALTTDEEEQYRYPSVSSFLKYIHERWVVGGKARPDKHSISIINSQEREGEDLLERPGQHRRVEGVVEGELPVVQQRGVQPEAPRDVAGKVMTAGQIATVLGDIARGLVPTDLEDPRWPSSAGGMTRTFAPMVRLADDFRALRGELERLRSRDEALIEATRLFGRGEGGARP